MGLEQQINTQEQPPAKTYSAERYELASNWNNFAKADFYNDLKQITTVEELLSAQASLGMVADDAPLCFPQKDSEDTVRVCSVQYCTVDDSKEEIPHLTTVSKLIFLVRSAFAQANKAHLASSGDVQRAYNNLVGRMVVSKDQTTGPTSEWVHWVDKFLASRGLSPDMSREDFETSVAKVCGEFKAFTN